MAPLTGMRLLFGSAPHFIIATSEERPLFMMNMGFRMEQMILCATQKGLGTCWIGGMFSEERIGRPDTSMYGTGGSRTWHS
ncbi:nitroreductase family protein [Chloroflexota bacterium]